MKKCPNCGQILPEHANYCSQCRCDFVAIETEAEAEGAEGRAEGQRAVFTFLAIVGTIIVLLLVLASRFA
ncbi:MAG TPA: hypothetical protein P5572_05260 [Phycisphaerae bacterium]|nr:zinc ribbon domain-containing protein [Phycisphaerales bacterium]HRX84410.1 hypothetical protein [Phycisphaerae bacterium]